MKLISISLLLLLSGCTLLSKAITEPLVEEGMQETKNEQFMRNLNEGWNLFVLDGKVILTREVAGKVLVKDFN